MILFVYSREFDGLMKKKYFIIFDVIFDKNVFIIFKV